MPYNILKCTGWESTGTGWVGSAPCIKARLGIVILFFLLAIVRKWGGEEMGLEFSLLFASIFSIVPYFLMITFTGNLTISFIVGLVGGVVGGYGGGAFFGGGEGY